MTKPQERAVLDLALEFYATRVLRLIRGGATTHRTLMGTLMEQQLAAGPDEADAVLNLLCISGRIGRSIHSLGSHMDAIYSVEVTE